MEYKRKSIDARMMDYPEPFLQASKALTAGLDELVMFVNDIQTVECLTQLAGDAYLTGVVHKEGCFAVVFRTAEYELALKAEKEAKLAAEKAEKGEE